MSSTSTVVPQMLVLIVLRMLVLLTLGNGLLQMPNGFHSLSAVFRLRIRLG